MSYVREVTVVAGAVDTLLNDPTVLDASETELALAGHGALIQLLSQTTSAIMHTNVEARHYGIPSLDRHPVALLERHLKSHPQIRTEKVTTLMETAPVTPKGQAWQTVLISSMRAQSAWSQTPRSLKPVGDEIWSHLADVAEISEALTLLDIDLANHLTTLKRSNDAGRLRLGARSGIAIAAREVRYVTAGGELPYIQDDSRESLRVLANPKPADLPEALSRMGHRLASGGPTTPRAFLAAAMATAMSAEAAAKTLHAAGIEQTAGRLQSVVKDLKYLQRLSKFVATAGPTTPASLEQARHIQQLLLGMHHRKEQLPLLDALAAAKEIPSALARMRDAADQQLRSGHWLVMGELKGAKAWVRADMAGPAPVFLERIQTLASRSEPLSAVLRDVQPRWQPAPAPTPRDIVRAALNRRGPPPRPGLPGLARYVNRTTRT
ncbi:hypothetical protein Kisp01_50330 [Kineosporia sp. NBRC 101677]|uniref:hypothetical protein n=1 Tax=Kineosporia sp. NBRC 101677 TaxID=3032197 RepID=UPI0024A57EF4|nr:hypothetical protein [Kineosporia sp. NBRC 101677]GLY18019.1 hypothetical protein Kisp01_50330 [Kineosporia sp. NBRC 101677]